MNESNQDSYARKPWDKRRESKGAITELRSSPEMTQVLTDVSHFCQFQWLEKYEPSWIRYELVAAVHFVKQNPLQKPKSWGNFLSTWLDKHSKGRIR